MNARVWNRARKDIEDALAASVTLQEKAYYASTLALMTIADSMAAGRQSSKSGSRGSSSSSSSRS